MERCKATILGNHDQAALFDPDGFNPMALQAIYWTRDQLDNGWRFASRDQQAMGLSGRAAAQDRRRRASCSFMVRHGIRPTNMFFPSTSLINARWRFCLARSNSTASWVTRTFPEYSRRHANSYRRMNAITFTNWEAEKVLVNVGSVGQPRDDDNRSCYVVLDTDDKTVTYRRVEYDSEKTANKIYAVADLIGCTW